MAIEVERLIATLEARLDKFEKSLAKASGVADKNFKKIEDRGNLMESRLARLGVAGFKGFASGAVAAVAPVLTLTAAINTVKSALDTFGKVADQSAAAGVDPEFWQAFAYEARQAGIETDAAASALANFNKNAGQATAEYGRLLTALQQFSPETIKQLQLARTQEERIKAVADAIARQTDVSRQAALATAAFGAEGVKLVQILNQGAAGVDKFVANARGLGLVVDRDLIKRADELGDKFQTAAEIIDIRLKKAAIDLAPALVDLVNLGGEFLRLMALAYEQTKSIEQRQFVRPLQNQLAAVYQQIADVNASIAEMEAQLSGGGPNGMILKIDIGTAQSKLAALKKQADELLNRITELEGRPATPAATTPPAVRVPGSNLDDSRRNRKYANVPEPAVAVSGLRQVEQAAIDVAGAAATISPELEAMNDRIRTAQDLAQSFANSFIDGILSGDSAIDVLTNSLADLAKQLVSMFTNNAISGLFGGLFGTPKWNIPTSYVPGGFYPGLAGGGRVNAGQPYTVGETGREMFVPESAGRIVPISQAKRGGGVVNNVYNYGSDRVETKSNASGGIDVIIKAVEDRIKGNMAKGQYRSLGVSPGMRRT